MDSAHKMHHAARATRRAANLVSAARLTQTHTDTFDVFFFLHQATRDEISRRKTDSARASISTPPSIAFAGFAIKK
jgi:hypothetical protein